MIVTDNKPATMDGIDTNAVPPELPPPYIHSQAGTREGNATAQTTDNPSTVVEDMSLSLSASPSSSKLSTAINSPQKPPSNFVIVKRANNSISDSYVIDTQLHIPEGLVSPISPVAEGSEDVYEDGLISGEKPHIYLESTHGSVNADIWLIRGRGGVQPGQELKADKPISEDRALVNVKSSHSSVNTKLHCDTEQPYILCCSSKYGSVSVWIPSTFIGPATFTTTYGKVVLSPGVQERCTTFSEINNVRTCFIGDYGAAGFRNLNEWKGSILQISTSHSKISVNFVDELSSSPKDGNGFSWSKMFNWK
ncbi:hypothetical protein SCHPADRAFT_999978 [Schizopora paradoxa]|uniref:DUF7330 domain-containing protein n=1 Tax=Schizopora paradoxa TaxID=27342 RepID=A0A0H2RDF7_9AGAM|nr:hypothetical protein SCHPADRAFT_999978 [Schizopora paradoxa]